MTCMMDVMRRLERDLHNTIELTGRIPEEWHEIATATPRRAGVKGLCCTNQLMAEAPLSPDRLIPRLP
jgi:hypothetical protein